MIRDYIDSGILETYVMGSASEDEVKELLHMKAKYPEVNEALQQLELDMEKIAMHMAITPPPAIWDKIEQEIGDIIPHNFQSPEPYKERNNYKENRNHDSGNQFIEVESESSHMRIHKTWKWVFAAVFVLGKIFLGCAIYFYLENRQAQQQLQELKIELKQLKK
ncbi:hypothetical protein SAMN05216464_10592 [Mucilaginibacter pineti]|uniref:Uncharacterized protein n=2 Tax=Mucilaginibacter pineti TaxID=1391627 RepID=A0A1G7BN47_9SPHI|nr:hypothetical protein SAMN05216464_10592 [Mucilaginibacter pineti]